MRFCTKTNGLKIIIYGSLIFLCVNFITNRFENTFKSAFPLSKTRSIVKYVPQNKSHVSDITLMFQNNPPSNDKLLSSTNASSILYVEHDIYNKSKLPICANQILEQGGPIKPNITLESLSLLEKRFEPFLNPGGWFTPNCMTKHHVAVVVPFRDRYAHLSIFLKNIHPFLMRQNIEYRIYVIEQTNGMRFNRAALMNVGYIEALKFTQWDCFIFHDVDLIPLDERNLYTCPNQPRHMSVAIDIFGYISIFGGVSAISRDHFSLVNGFSNSFWGWGGEDDDMSNRLKHANLYISRYPMNIARYTMLQHRKEIANPKRYENLLIGASKFKLDGLNSIKYDVYSTKDFPLFTWLLVELKMTEQR